MTHTHTHSYIYVCIATSWSHFPSTHLIKKIEGKPSHLAPVLTIFPTSLSNLRDIPRHIKIITKPKTAQKNTQQCLSHAVFCSAWSLLWWLSTRVFFDSNDDGIMPCSWKHRRAYDEGWKVVIAVGCCILSCLILFLRGGWWVGTPWVWYVVFFLSSCYYWSV